MHSRHALATAVALADYLETFTSETRLENIVQLAEALQSRENDSKLALVSPQHLGKLIEALPEEVLRQLKVNGHSRS